METLKGCALGCVAVLSMLFGNAIDRRRGPYYVIGGKRAGRHDAYTGKR